MHGHRNHSEASLAHAVEQTHSDMHVAGCSTNEPTHDVIAHRAYDIYIRSGSKQGHCKQNWQQAEVELQTA